MPEQLTDHTVGEPNANLYVDSLRMGGSTRWNSTLEAINRRLLSVDPYHLRLATAFVSLAGAGLFSLLVGAHEVNALGTTTEITDTASTELSLAEVLHRITGRIINTIQQIDDIEATQDLLQPPSDEGFLSGLGDFLVDGVESVGNIYEHGEIFSKNNPKMVAGLFAGGVHAMFRLKELIGFLRDGYDAIVDPSQEYLYPEDRQKGRLEKTLDSFGVSGILKSLIIPSHFIDSFLTSLTVANFRPTPAHLLNLAMLGVKYKITDMGYKNMIGMENLIREKMELEKQGIKISKAKVFEFVVRAYPLYFSIGAIDLSVDAILFFRWLAGEKPDEY